MILMPRPLTWSVSGQAFMMALQAVMILCPWTWRVLVQDVMKLLQAAGLMMLMLMPCLLLWIVFGQDSMKLLPANVMILLPCPLTWNVFVKDLMVLLKAVTMPMPRLLLWGVSVDDFLMLLQVNPTVLMSCPLTWCVLVQDRTVPLPADLRAMACPLTWTVAVQDFMVPLQATLDTSWHMPAKKRTTSTMTVRLSLSDLHLQPSFGHVPMLQALLDQAKASAAKRNEVRPATCTSYSRIELQSMERLVALSVIDAESGWNGPWRMVHDQTMAQNTTLLKAYAYVIVQPSCHAFSVSMLLQKLHHSITAIMHSSREQFLTRHGGWPLWLL